MIGTIGELAPQIAAGIVSSPELLRQCLAAIAADNRTGRRLGAILSLNPEASTNAAALDTERLQSGSRGPLHGIPIVIKDNIDVAGMPTTSGSVALAAAMPRSDADVVRRLRAAGAVIIGKANMAEFSFEVRSRSSLGGDVRNPYDPTVSAGGSSGGTAAAVAAGFAVAGLGTDTGGSIRIPASFCGLVGVRPSHGAFAMSGIAPLAPAADTVGPITRDTADAALILAVMGMAPQAGEPRPGPVRLGIVRQAFGTGEVAVIADTVIARLVDAGVVVHSVTLPAAMVPDFAIDAIDLQFRAAFDAYLAGNFAAGAPASLAAIVAGDAVLPDCRAVLRRRAAAAADAKALADHQRRADDLRAFLVAALHDNALDGLLYPTAAVAPTSFDNPACGWAPELSALAGLPAVSFPVARSARGMPIGFDLLGPRNGEMVLLGIVDRLRALLDRA